MSSSSSSSLPTKKQRRRGGNQKKKKRPRLQDEDDDDILPLALINSTIPQRLRLKRETGKDSLVEFTSDLINDAQQVDYFQTQLATLVNIDPLEPLEPLIYKQGQSLVKPLSLLKAQVWVRHTRLRDVTTPDSPEDVRELLRSSWVLVCRLGLMERQLADVIETKMSVAPWPRELHTRAEMDYAYAKTMGRYRHPISLAYRPDGQEEKIGAYPVSTLMTSMSVLCEALDTYGWSPSAGDYLNALFLRYALIIQEPGRECGPGTQQNQWLGQWEAVTPSATIDNTQEEDDNDPMDVEVPPLPATPEEGEEEEIRDKGYTIPQEARPLTVIEDYEDVFIQRGQGEAEPRLFPARLRTSFLDVGERFFFHHLWRNQSVRALATPGLLELPLRLKKHQARAQWRLTKGLVAFFVVLKGVLEDDLLHDRLLTNLGDYYPPRLLWPGEREQMLFDYPTESEGGSAETTLFRLRIDHYKRLQDLIQFNKEHHSDPVHFLAQYVAQERALAQYILKGPPSGGGAGKRVTEGEWLDKDVVRNRLGVDHERLLLLWFEMSFNMRLVGENGEPLIFTRHAYIDDRSLQGAAARPPQTRKSLLADCQVQSRWPRFVALWYNYTVAGLAAAQMANSRAPGTTKEGTSLFTPHLVDAVGAWLALARWSNPHSAQVLKNASFCQPGSAWHKLIMPLELLDKEGPGSDD